MSLLNKMPWTFLLIGYMVVAQILSLNMEGVFGYIFLGLAMFVLFAEFFKSGDINAGTFLLDLVFSVLALIVATALMCYLIFSPDPNAKTTFFHWFGCAVILGDAILSPFNAFRTALRNLTTGGGF